MRLRDATVSVAMELLYKAGKMKDHSGCTFLEKAVERFAHNNPRGPDSLGFGKLCTQMLAWSICGFLALYGIDHHYARAAMQGRETTTAFCNLAKTIATQGIRRPLSLSAPISVVWSLSKRCNLHCEHCYQDAESFSKEEMRLDEQLEVVEQLAETGVALVVLSGGEPLLNRHIFTLIRRITDHGMAFALDSNGILIDRIMAARLKDSGISSVEISIDSISSARHDEFRGMHGAFERAREALVNCSKQGIFTTVASTVTRRNLGEVERLVDLAKTWGARRIAIFDLIPAGRGTGLMDVALSQQERADLMRFIMERSRLGDIELVLELPQLAPYTMMEDGAHENAGPLTTNAFSVEKFTVTSYLNMAGHGTVYRSLAPYLGGCPAGRFYCNIQPNGDVTPCMFMPTYPVAGNLQSNSFREIWSDSPVFRRLRERKFLKGRCRSCTFTSLCGGCRAKAAAYFGDYLREDPDCPLAENLSEIARSSWT